MTTENETTDPTADQLAELAHELAMAKAIVAQQRGPALRETIRSAGFDPDSTAGRVLAELAGDDEAFGSSTTRMRAKAEALGLTAEASPDGPTPAVQTDPGLNDPNQPADHPRNTVGTLAYRFAARDRSLREKSSQVLDNMTAPPVTPEPVARPAGRPDRPDRPDEAGETRADRTERLWDMMNK